MLIDLHAHSSGISRCCRIPAEKVVQTAKEIGLDGIVLTNHYDKNYVSDGNYRSFAERYVAEYKYAKRCGEAIGCKVFFGIEVTMAKHNNVHMLVYGVEETFLLEHPTVFDCSQQELYTLVHENGGILVQAHPFRGNTDRLLDTQYLDGVEVSCHPMYEGTHAEELCQIAKDCGLILTCGGDYHADTHRPHCGVYLPDNIQNSREMIMHLLSADEIKLCVHEVGDTASHMMLFHCAK